MTTWFISRHPGAIAWMEQQSIRVDRWEQHLDPAEIAPGDRVYGSLPIHLAEQVCRRGGRYFHLQIDLARAERGRELPAEELVRRGASVREFIVRSPK